MARLIDAIEQEMPYCPDTDYEIGYQNGLTMAKAIILKLDAVEVVHGRWEPRPHHKFNSEGRLIKYCDFYYCSECGTERPMVPPYNYCPNCGAKMDGEREDNGHF